jgi:hypothetical protein
VSTPARMGQPLASPVSEARFLVINLGQDPSTPCLDGVELVPGGARRALSDRR